MIAEVVDIDKIVISKEFAYGKLEKNEKLEKMEKKDLQYFINYKNDEKVKPLCIKLPKLSRDLNSFRENKMHVLFDQRR